MKMKVNKGSGFTLVELILAMVVFGILVALALPNFDSLLKNSRLRNAASDIAIAFNLARQAAVSRNQPSFICHSVSGNDDAPSCGGTASDWMAGYIIYHPPTRTLVGAPRDYNSGSDTLIQQASINSQGLEITKVNADSHVMFLGDGTLVDKNATPIITICDDRTGETGKSISISSVGRVNTIDFQCT